MRRSLPPKVLALLLVTAAAAGAGPPADLQDGAPTTVVLTRSFRLAAAPMHYRIGDFWVETVFDLEGFAGNVDLVSVHQDFFGVPWDELLAGQPPPDFWWSLRDFVPAPMHGVCPCAYHPIWCALYDAVDDMGLLAAWFGWGAMGILDFDLEEKPAFTTWKTWQQRPVTLTPTLPAPRHPTRRLRP